ncbi:MAG TPA: hypothetical protein VKU85_21380, partial [bacterium]|nr:hypothetical protein [bacterium]
PVLGSPVIDWIGAAGPSVIIAPESYEAWSYDADGAATPGWPRTLSAAPRDHVTGAVGDVDGDGDNEVVFVTDFLEVFDVNHPSSPDDEQRWPMEGFDPGRSGCAACPSGGSPVDATITGDDRVATSLELAAPFPNPSRDGFGLSYSLPTPATVRLEAFDVLGRRTAVLESGRREAGRHSAAWNATDDAELRVSPGIYFVRLRVDSPDGIRTATRKVTVLR